MPESIKFSMTDENLRSAFYPHNSHHAHYNRLMCIAKQQAAIAIDRGASDEWRRQQSLMMLDRFASAAKEIFKLEI